ncbi:hypothetical protein ACQXVK_13905 [Curtobacterium sp. AB451]|uniref:hypothetical protein n=1 Tax=Curtobacterium sp. AB451 TaxID=3422306 RepID=UPI003D339193
MNRSSSSFLGFVAVVGLLTTATACASNGGDERQPDEAKQNAVAFLRETMDHEPLAWPGVPDPVATRCSDGEDGVRFQYLVMIDQKTDPKELATSFEEFWRRKGLDVRPSHEDFGKYGVAYSATARADGKP